MILYFSGTGNSAYAAEKISRETGDDVVDLFERIRSHDYSAVHSGRPWVIVSPTYAWRIPRILDDWLAHTEMRGSKDIYFIMTCGGSIGNAGEYLKKMCASKGMNYMGCRTIVMPENYLAMFEVPEREEALQIIKRAEGTIVEAAQYIKKEKALPAPSVSLRDRVSSGIVNDVYYPMFVHAKKFYATDACISCGKCEKLCPLNNIRILKGKPVWGNQCTHCMACICRCPSEAIEYGKHSIGKPRYVCPKLSR